MRGDLALFDGDSLLERQEILVTSMPKVERFGFFRASYKLGPDAAEVVLDDFASRVELKVSPPASPSLRARACRRRDGGDPLRQRGG